MAVPNLGVAFHQVDFLCLSVRRRCIYLYICCMCVLIMTEFCKGQKCVFGTNAWMTKEPRMGTLFLCNKKAHHATAGVNKSASCSRGKGTAMGTRAHPASGQKKGKLYELWLSLDVHQTVMRFSLSRPITSYSVVKKTLHHWQLFFPLLFLNREWRRVIEWFATTSSSKSNKARQKQVKWNGH